jgi:hypothetical protein
MPNTLTLYSEDPVDILATGNYGAGALLKVQWCATQLGAYADLVTVPLVAGTRAYTAYDQAGTATTWYRTRYENVGGSLVSAWSEAFQVEGLTTYCSLADVKSLLEIAVSDTASDQVLVQLINHTAGFIETKTRRRLYPDPVTTYTFDGFSAIANGRCLLVPNGVRSLSNFAMATVTGGTPVAVTAADLVLRPLPQDRSPGWPATQIWLTDIASVPYFYPGYGNIVAAGTFGWEAVPREIEAIALRLVISSWRGRSAGGGDTFTIGVEGERTFERMLSYQDKLTLQSYGEPVFLG